MPAAGILEYGISDGTAYDNQQDGVDLEAPGSDEYPQENQDTDDHLFVARSEVLLIHQNQCGSCQQTDYPRAESVEYGYYSGMLLVFQEETADEYHEDE